MLSAVLTAFLIGTALGVLSSRKPNGPLSQFINVLSLVGFAAPVFWTGIMLVILFASVLPILPVSGMRAADASGGGWLDLRRRAVASDPADADARARLPRAVQPAGALVDARRARLRLHPHGARQGPGRTRRALQARAAQRGAPGRHRAGLQFGNVLAGAILVETVFNWPGLGRLAFESVLRRDYPTILGVLVFSSIVVIAMNLLTDLAYRLIDPRIKAT